MNNFKDWNYLVVWLGNFILFYLQLLQIIQMYFGRARENGQIGWFGYPKISVL